MLQQIHKTAFKGVNSNLLHIIIIMTRGGKEFKGVNSNLLHIIIIMTRGAKTTPQDIGSRA